eukprot:Gregarina_sp_Poly_1__3374@NODE_1973_length_2949_cov_301_490285_g1271_i0_p2_GENE_NODE_1973_length_2949_cov_301_490285_g1271_i0NODE_1973_length_2949_cov_301_490285_g1271_i0_p2_ORF_typecomplete_len270_score45_28PNP_UDP_1/PF01048_20/8_1e35RWPRK/PF02042_15/5_7e02RWPRK/PF02042_15/1_5_NODE_1973_length_2949_cov_301_490285_g1271_i058810
MEGAAKQPHISLGKEDIQPVCIVVGDPARTEQYAKLCDEYKELAYNREYRSFSCTYKGKKFLILSHGVGCSGATVAFRELIELGVKVIFRAGTCGSLQNDKIRQGDVVVCYAAAKEDGVTKLLEPAEMPAVADPHVTEVLRDAAKSLDLNVSLGITVSSDLFYAPKVMPSSLKMWKDLGVAVVEMEASALFTICRQYNIKGGCICAVDGSPFKWKEGDYAPEGDAMNQGKERMGLIAIEAARRLTEECEN